MKKIILLLFISISVLGASNIKLEGFIEASLGRNYNDDLKRWDVWEPNFFVENKLIIKPVNQTEVFVKFYADKDNDNYKQKKKLEAVLSEAWVKYRKESNKKGIEFKFFTRGGSHYWLDGTLLNMVNPDQVKNGDNGQGARTDIWFDDYGSLSYVFSDFSQKDNSDSDDVHLFRLRNSFLKNKLKTGAFYLRKNYSSANKNDYNEVISADIQYEFLQNYFLTVQAAKSWVPADTLVSNQNKYFSEKGIEGDLKSNFAFKTELNGLKLGLANIGWFALTPGFYSFGDTYRNYMGEDNSNRWGYWLNSYYQLPYHAVTITANYSESKKWVPDKQIINSATEKYYNPETNLYLETYIEFIKGFKGKVYFNNKQNKQGAKKYNHKDLFFEMQVENKLAKLVTQYKIKDIDEDYEKQIAGIETSVNLTNNVKFFARGLALNENSGSRYAMFYEIQYRIAGNTELYLQYGPSWYGDNGLTNDDDFVSGGDMKKELKLLIKAWF